MHTVILNRDTDRHRACQIINAAPKGYVATIREPRRTKDQNDLMWTLLTKISIAKPEGRMHTPETWKLLVMHACGHECQFEMGLDGRPFPTGFRSSQLSVRQMADLITWIQAYAAEHGVDLSEPETEAA